MFKYVLETVAAASIDIHKISIPPTTSLAEDERYIKCERQNEKNIVPIITYFAIESPSSDIEPIDELFNEESKFINDSRNILTDVFGARVEFEGDTEENNVFIGIEEWVIILIIAGSVFIICVIIIGVLWRNKRRRAKLEALTQYISNPMIISIAIGKYDSKPKKELVEDVGYFRNLDGIENDIKNVIGTFSDTFDFNVLPEYDVNARIKIRWSLKEIMDLFNYQAQILEDNIVELDDNGVIIKDGFDGLVVIVSCHGIRNYIITSDYHV